MVDWVWQRVSWKSCSSWAPQRRCSFLTGSELQDKYISCQLVLIAFILFLLSLSLFCPDLRLCVVPLCEITCGILPDTRGELLIQMCSLISTQILNHVLVPVMSVLPEAPATHSPQVDIWGKKEEKERCTKIEKRATKLMKKRIKKEKEKHPFFGMHQVPHNFDQS